MLDPLERQAAGVRVVLSGVDTLHLHTAAPLRSAMVRELERLKIQAAGTAPGDPPVVWHAGGHAFNVKAHGGRRGPLLLDSEAMAVSLNPHAPRGLPTGIVELRAQHLWQGYDTAAGDVEEIFSVLTEGEHPDMQVSRIDLAADWQGWEPTPSLLEHFTCRARQDATYRSNRRFSGWSWGGGGAVLARLYDKTREIEGSDKAEWFPKLWAEHHRGFDPTGRVWRIEFQVKRECLREAQAQGVGEEAAAAFRSWRDARKHLGSLFRALSARWLELRLPRTGRERRRPDPRWLAVVAGAMFVDSSHDLDVRRVRAEGALEERLNIIAGYMGKAMGLRWFLRGPDEKVFDTYRAIFWDIQRQLSRKGTSLEAKVAETYEPLRSGHRAEAARRQLRERLN